MLINYQYEVKPITKYLSFTTIDFFCLSRNKYSEWIKKYHS
jgi:hypothetical protein